MERDKFRLSDGVSLTRYAFACGYLQSAVFGDGNEQRRVQLSQDGCYHIKAMAGSVRVAWYTAASVAEARRKYAGLKKLARKSTAERFAIDAAALFVEPE